MSIKNPTLGITYEVREDPSKRGRWNVLRGGKITGESGPSIHMAVSSAIGLAQQEAKTSIMKVKVVSVVSGKRVSEWASE